MDESEICGKPTLSGEPCGWFTGPCPHHKKPRPPSRQPLRPGEPSVPADAAEPAPIARPPGIKEHAGIEVPEDLRAFAWWVIHGVVRGNLEERKGSVLVAAARLAAALGPDADAEEDALAATVLRGRVMHGLPPDSDDEWALAEALFTAAGVEELRRWTGLFERDLVDDLQPERLFDSSALEAELPLVVDIEDRSRGEF